MTIMNQVTEDLKNALKENAPQRTGEKAEREKRILNSSNQNFISYGLKISEIDKIVRSILKHYKLDFKQASQIFKKLVDTDIYDEKMAAISFISRFKKKFDDSLIEVYENTLKTHCDTWAFCDSSMIKIIGPYLAKKKKRDLANQIIEKWSDSNNLWVNRASLVVFLKITMLHKNFDEMSLYRLLENLMDDSEGYIQKAVAWALKTCSKYKPKLIFDFLLDNHDRFSRSILRTACEKLPETLRRKLLN